MSETLLGLNGNAFTYLGMAFSLFMTGLGSAKGVGIVGEAMTGVIIEDPDRFGPLMILQIIPSTNGIYGFLITFIILSNTGIMGGGVNIPLSTGILLFLSTLPIGIVGYFSAIYQARIAAGGVNIVAKRPDQLAKAIITAVMVETYQILALLVSMLLVVSTLR
jgi:V/A-type H+-transporting ATPase subunit K